MLKIKELNIPGFKKVIEAQDPEAGLHCFIAIHDTTLGPSLGGARIYPYSTPKDALEDVLKLAKAMTYKSAIAETGLGGGKSVIIASPKEKSRKLLLAFGKVIDSLQGQYIAAEDVGSTSEDLAIVRENTPYVVALSSTSGDPSPFTAWGVFRGIQAVAKKLWGSTSLQDKTILIQGVGKAGGNLANFLFWEGANLIIADVDPTKSQEMKLHYGAKIIDPTTFYDEKCDIFSPCALGGSINSHTINKLKCKAIAGCANNQLESPELGTVLMKRNILYAPDYVINSGGLLNVATELDPKGYNAKIALKKTNHIYDILTHIFDLAEKENLPTSTIADSIAERKLIPQ